MQHSYTTASLPGSCKECVESSRNNKKTGCNNSYTTPSLPGSGTKINRSHTHTPTENNTPDNDTHTHTTRTTFQTNTSHKHLVPCQVSVYVPPDEFTCVAPPQFTKQQERNTLRMQNSYTKPWPIQDILLLTCVCKNQSFLYYPRPFALPTLLQYDYATFAQYMPPRPSLVRPYTIKYW